VLKGLLAGGISVGIAAVFPEALIFPFFLAVLGLLSGVYPGLAMAPEGPGRAGLEWTAAVVLLAFGMVGLWVSPLFLVGAWLLRGLWDFLHFTTVLGEGIPEGFPGGCILYDLVVCGFVAYMWSAGL
jgi:hypothetical protein